MNFAAVVLGVVTFAVAGQVPAIPTLIALPRPPFAYSFHGNRPAAPAARLIRISERANRITDVDRWFQANNIQWPAVEDSRLSRGGQGRLPPAVPKQFAGLILIRAVISPPLVLAIYGEDFAGGRYVIGSKRSPSLRSPSRLGRHRGGGATSSGRWWRGKTRLNSPW